MRRIVVGVDGSEGARRALAWAVEEGQQWGASVVAVHAWSAPVMASPVGLAPLAVVPDITELQRAGEDLLAQMVHNAVQGHEGVRVEPVVVEGPPAEALVEAAKEADLLVVGSRGHGGFVGLLLGSVSQHCAHHASCPVVVVPPERSSS